MFNRRITINEKIYDVIDSNLYFANLDVYYNDPTIAIENNGMVYPVHKSERGVEPGVYVPNKQMQPFGYYIVEPTTMNYSVANIIDFSQANSIHDIINLGVTISQIENEILTSSNNTCAPHISEDDSPDLKGLKQAITLKKCDMDLYESRFGKTYGNDKRLLKKKTISMKKLISICNCLDIKAELVFSDAGKNISNPMGETIRVNITGEFEEGEGEE